MEVGAMPGWSLGPARGHQENKFTSVLDSDRHFPVKSSGNRRHLSSVVLQDQTMKLVENIGCPALDCPESHQIALSHSCCKVCKGTTLVRKAKSLLCKNADGSGASDTNRRQKAHATYLNFLWKSRNKYHQRSGDGHSGYQSLDRRRESMMERDGCQPQGRTWIGGVTSNAM